MKKPKDEAVRTYATVSTSESEAKSGSAGQSGDNQGLSDVAEAGPESVEQLVEEGQAFEADAISGVENAPDADVSEVHTKQVSENDVPSEYRGQD
jgi:N utilization substance protein A